jgi:hypothetical protein
MEAKGNGFPSASFTVPSIFWADALNTFKIKQTNKSFCINEISSKKL